MRKPNPKKTLLPFYFFPSLEHRTTAAVLPSPDRLSFAFPAYRTSLLLLRIRVKEPSFLPHLQVVRKLPTILTGNRRLRRRNASTVVFVIDFMGSVHGKCFYCCRCCCFPGWSICGNCCCPGWMNCGNCCFHLPPSSSGSASRGGRSGEVEPLRGDMLAGSTEGTAAISSHGFCLQYSSLTRQGLYPDEPDRENQDALCIKTNLQGNTNLHFFGVFDGHGYFGAKCANFVRDKLVDILSADSQLVEDPAKAYNTAFLAVNALLHESEIDDSLSGTTAITVLISGDTLIVANVGDSRAVAAVSKDGCLVAEDLSHDQTPFRKDECERVRLCGARVLSIDQVEGIKDPGIQSWGEEGDDEGDPPRLWVQDAMFPGTAFTRSVGDSTAESIGVIALPEVLTINITPNHLFLVIASDGIFEFMSSQAVVNKVASFKDPRDACSAVAAESYKLWLEHENRTDDITIIVVHIKDLCNPGAGTSSETIQITTKAFVSSENLRAERSPTSITEPLHPPQGSFSDPRPHCDIALARSPVRATLVHSISLEK